MQPSYVKLYQSGELEKRAERLWNRLESCDLCPRECNINRLIDERGFCRTGALPPISSACAHHGEEPAISGDNGSGTIFFGHCNMRCAYCQNYQISQDPGFPREYEVPIEVLAEKLLYLQNRLHCHNINFVTPSHVVPQIVKAVLLAIPQGLSVPLIYNTSSYDSLSAIQELNGIFDIYLADLRYASNEKSLLYSQAPGYREASRDVLREMYRQTGNLVKDDEGIAQRGLIVRHLILPEDIAGSEDSLRWLAEELSPEVTISVMSQYYPTFHAGSYPSLRRKITPHEYREVLKLMEKLGLENGWIQEMESAEAFRPDFNNTENPFL